MRELSLFTGVGGGLLGTLLLGWEPVGYVEFNEYRQRILTQRIKDGIFPKAPIFGDIRTFISEGYAASYQGMVDVITAGFPCQPFSTAGKQLGYDDPRNMWPATIECIRIVRPKYALLENVPGLVTSGYFGTVLRDLAESGYSAKWGSFSAKSLGGAIDRERLFIACTDEINGQTRLGNIPNRTQEILRENAEQCNGLWLQTPSTNTRVGNGMAHYNDRVSAIGDGQVPAVVKLAWEILTNKGTN